MKQPKEVLHFVTFNEKPSEAALPKEICRLRYGLNANCLLEVFHYLSVYVLIQVCKLDIFLKN